MNKWNIALRRDGAYFICSCMIDRMHGHAKKLTRRYARKWLKRDLRKEVGNAYT